MKRRFAFLLLPFALSPHAGSLAASIEGQWVPPGGDAVIEVSVRETARLTLLRTLEHGRRDSNNPVKALRQRTLEGLTIGSDFVRAGQGGAWVDGTLYDPASGRTYKAQMRLLEDDRLELRGYVGFVALGRSEIWIRRELFERQILRMLVPECAP